ncbi:MAG: N-6 DNA methylase [Clostridia bacterium]|nr:N-6 DNA methylase [Clostridia bacterium]
MDFKDFLNFLKDNFSCYEANNNLEIIVNGAKLIIETEKKSFYIDGGIKCDHTRIFNLNKKENWSVIMLLIKLFTKGYNKNVMYLEKAWQLGHDFSGYLDLMLTNPQNNNIYMIEAKTSQEISKYTNINKPKELKQSLSYAMQEKNTKLVSYYAYDFESKTDLFYNIYLDDILNVASNTEDLFDRWNKTFDREDFILKNPLFNIKPKLLEYNDLVSIDKDMTKLLYNQFLTILRLNSVSDKPNAFNKMINLFLCKIVDENSGDCTFTIEDKNGLKHTVSGLRFQYIANLDTPNSFIKRLNELYKKGMEDYLNKNIIDYTDEEVDLILKSANSQIRDMVDNLRLKKNNNFSFIEVYDDYTFLENFGIVRDIVKLFQSSKFKYDYKQQFLGDFFEDLLNTSLKQEAGQFFTPYPLVDFITESIPFAKIMESKIKNRDPFIPSIIDYACGAGHFLVSGMDVIQREIESLDQNKLNSAQLKTYKIYKDNPYFWVNPDNVVGIEKDYRLAKTTKIATFFNGDGNAEIISGDGINKFSANEFKNTCLYSEKNCINKFDVLLSNPPYSVKGFMYNFQKNDIRRNDGTFSLLKEYNFNDAMIENFFVERAYQLLKPNGKAAIILPQSILNLNKYEALRKFIFKHFKINALLLTSDITFLGTTTSPVVLFLTKETCANLDYNTMVIYSDKYYDINTKKSNEEYFLGYKFSSDRNKSGTEQLSSSKLKIIQPILKSFLEDETVSNLPSSIQNNILYTKLQNIIVETSDGKEIYPKYIPADGKSLRELGVEMNPDTEVDNDDYKYVEISNIINQKITESSKSNTDYRICKKDDILISSLVPSKSKIAIADKPYRVSKAIYIIRTNDSELRNKIFNELGEDYSIKQMHSLLEGFKLTYSKIKEEKMYDFVKLKI